MAYRTYLLIQRSWYTALSAWWCWDVCPGSTAPRTVLVGLALILIVIVIVIVNVNVIIPLLWHTCWFKGPDTLPNQPDDVGVFAQVGPHLEQYF